MVCRINETYSYMLLERIVYNFPPFLFVIMPKRRCKFTDELQSKYLCFRAGRVEWEAECMTYTPGTYISIANKGSGDLEIHMNSEKHCRNCRGETSSEKLTKYFVKSNTKLDESVCAAEGTLAFHTVAHHNSFKSMDCKSKLLREIFNDSEVAKSISSVVQRQKLLLTQC